MKKFLLLNCICLCLTFAVQGQEYISVESVEYDALQNRFLVSNGNSIIARASDGTLSYFGNAIANYGMEIMGGNLFAITNATIKGYNLKTGDEVMSLNITGAGFLNGMATDGTFIYVTDFGQNKIIRIDVSNMMEPTFAVVVDNTGSQPNGIVYDEDNDRLIFVSWGSNAEINAVSLTDFSVSNLTTTSLGNIDGIDNDAYGNYYVSSWTPTRITRYNNDFSLPETISAPGIVNPADICYAKEIDSLAIPNGNATVTFVGFETPVAVQEQLANEQELVIYPNPVKSEGAIYFENKKDEVLTLDLFDQKGQLVRRLLDGQQNLGLNTVLLNGIDLKGGYYICRLTQDGDVISRPLIVVE